MTGHDAAPGGEGADPLKEIPESVFADDDGSADARLAQALIQFGAGKQPLSHVVDALAYARVLVPVLASGDERIVGKHGLEQDHVASTGVVAVQLPDGRAGLPVFADVAAVQAWNAQARPIPAEGPRAALACVSEQWSVMVLNPGLDSVVIPRPAVWALAQGRPWRPAVTDGRVDAEVREAVADAVPTDDVLRAVDVQPGRTAEIAVVLGLRPGLTQPEVNDVVARVNAALGNVEVVAERVDSLELRLASA